MNLGRRPKEAARTTPGWVVSFTDMITLLLSFFIMLQAMGSTRDQEAFLKGQGGFRRAVSGLGIPDWVYGRKETVDLGNPKRKHPMEDDPDNLEKRRVIDAEDERIRKMFADMRRLMKTRTDQYQGAPVRLMATPIAFAAGDAETLPDEADRFLRQFAAGLEQQGTPAPPAITVIGLAPDQTDVRAQYLVSAGRAHAVAAALKGRLPEKLLERGATVTSWGAGPGKRWWGPGGAVPQGTQIVLAVMDAPRKE